MKLAIKGHLKRGNEVIETLEMLGGVNTHNLYGDENYAYYTIDSDKEIKGGIYVFGDEQLCQFTLEQFEEKFPYKVGDEVVYKTYGIHSKIKTMLWNVEKEQVFYRLESNKLFVATSDELKPLKKEIMEEKEPEPKAPILSNRYDYAEGKCGYVIPDGYEFDSIKQGFQTEIILRPIKSQYPKTYEECCKVLMGKTDFQDFTLVLTMLSRSINEENIISPEPPHITLINNFYKLLICRDAYWKIAGEQMGLGKAWEPDFENDIYYIYYDTQKRIFSKDYCAYGINVNHFLVFPTEEMRDDFYENFKELIENCKELL